MKLSEIKQLLERREEICFEMIEARGRELKELEQELNDLEMDIEINTGKTIDELEQEFYKGEDHA